VVTHAHRGNCYATNEWEHQIRNITAKRNNSNFTMLTAADDIQSPTLANSSSQRSARRCVLPGLDSVFHPTSSGPCGKKGRKKRRRALNPPTTKQKKRGSLCLTAWDHPSNQTLCFLSGVPAIWAQNGFRVSGLPAAGPLPASRLPWDGVFRRPDLAQPECAARSRPEIGM
jgi:hypothetical protein